MEKEELERAIHGDVHDALRSVEVGDLQQLTREQLQEVRALASRLSSRLNDLLGLCPGG